jgi:hypothetical protein
MCSATAVKHYAKVARLSPGGTLSVCFGVAQICNLLYRRIAFCGTSTCRRASGGQVSRCGTLELSDALPIKNRRYGRLQICATTPRCALNTYRCPQASNIISSRHAHEERSSLLSLPLRRVRADCSKVYAAKKIRDVGDNIPPGSGCDHSHREGCCPQRPIFFLRGAPSKNMRAHPRCPRAASASPARASLLPKRSGTLGTTSLPVTVFWLCFFEK